MNLKKFLNILDTLDETLITCPPFIFAFIAPREHFHVSYLVVSSSKSFLLNDP